MAIRFKCECGKSYAVGPEMAGKKGKCAKCGAKFAIPSELPRAKTQVEQKEQVSARPRVYWAFLAFCIMMALMFLASGPHILVEIQRKKPDEVAIGMLSFGFIMVCYVAAPFLPRAKWVWIMDIVLICLGLPVCCLWPISVPLLVYWVKPETKAYFGFED
jgi:hypothetical protein